MLRAVTKITRPVGALTTRLQPVVPEHRFLGIHYSPMPITKLSPDYPYRSGLCAGPGLYVVSPNNHTSDHSLVRSQLLNGRHSYHVYVPECLPVETLSGARLEERAADFPNLVLWFGLKECHTCTWAYRLKNSMFHQRLFLLCGFIEVPNK